MYIIYTETHENSINQMDITLIPESDSLLESGYQPCRPWMGKKRSWSSAAASSHHSCCSNLVIMYIPDQVVIPSLVDTATDHTQQLAFLEACYASYTTMLNLPLEWHFTLTTYLNSVVDLTVIMQYWVRMFCQEFHFVYEVVSTYLKHVLFYGLPPVFSD